MTIQDKRLHLGCGSITPDGWINLDGSWNAWLAKYPTLRKLFKRLSVLPDGLLDTNWTSNILVHDVRKKLPFKDNYFSAIYASHLLEHLYFDEAERLLKECQRILSPGGVLRMVVPDLRAIILEYLDGTSANKLSDSQESIAPADLLNNKLLLRYKNPPTGNIFYKIYKCFKDIHSHKWMYDADSLSKIFERAGFVSVQEMQLYQSRIIGIEDIENPKQVLNGAGIIAEGIKL